MVRWKMRNIGIVNSVSYDKLSFEISDFSTLEFNEQGQFYFAKGILDYVTVVNSQNEKFIYQVEKIEDKEKLLSKDENAKFEYVGNVWANPIGIIKNKRIEYNLKAYPFLKNKVYLTTNDEYQIIFNTDKENVVKLGMIADKFQARIAINKLLTFHSAILGNTGSGKSTTVRRILTELKDSQAVNLHVHVFDVHTEYAGMTDNVIDVLNDYGIDINSLELQDWINLVKPSDLVQLPILRMALKLANAIEAKLINEIWLKLYIALTMYRNVQTDVVGKRTKIISLLEGTEIDVSEYSSQYGSFHVGNEENFINDLITNMQKIESEADNDAFLQNKLEEAKYTVSSFECLLKGLDFVFYLEECKGNTQARSYAATLETRIKEVQSRYEHLFEGEERSVSNEKITVYDVSQLDDDLLLFFVSYISKKLFNENKAKGIDDRDVNVLILEEAHRYISRDKENSKMFEIEIFKRLRVKVVSLGYSYVYRVNGQVNFLEQY